MLIDAVKKDLRISHNALDDSIAEDIEAAKSLITTAGVIADDNDPLVVRCIKNYCRWQYDFDKQGDRYKDAFVDLLKTLTLSMERRL